MAIVPLFSIKSPVYIMLITIIGAYGIALSAMVVSRILNPEPTRINQIKRWAIFIILFFVTLFFGLFNPFLHIDLSDPIAIILCSIVSVISAFVLSSVLSKNAGARELMVSITHWRINPLWYAIALFTLPVIYILTIIINLIITGQPISLLTAQIMAISPISLILMFFFTLLFSTAVAEEPGWRGFLLPMLQSRYSPLIASIVICFVWEPWHIGASITGLYPFDLWNIFINRILPTALGGVILYTWLYNRTGKNLLMVSLFHTSANTMLLFTPISLGGGYGNWIFIAITSLLALILIFTDKMWKRLPKAKPE